MLIDAKKTPMVPQIFIPPVKFSLISSMHPTIITPLIALVTLIKGVCKAGVTFQITM